MVVQGFLLLVLLSLLPTLVVSIPIALSYGFGNVMPNEDVAKALRGPQDRKAHAMIKGAARLFLTQSY